MSPDEAHPPFLDTTFILPFFQIHIEVEGFTINGYKAFLTKHPKVHVSELSIYEAKAKIHRLSRRSISYAKALKAFGANLATLRADERVVLHPYTPQDDKYYNLISSKKLGLDSFNIIILAQALNTGMLITEDREILRVREREEIRRDPVLGRIEIRQWKELKPSNTT